MVGGESRGHLQLQNGHDYATQVMQLCLPCWDLDGKVQFLSLREVQSAQHHWFSGGDGMLHCTHTGQSAMQLCGSAQAGFPSFDSITSMLRMDICLC